MTTERTSDHISEETSIHNSILYAQLSRQYMDGFNLEEEVKKSISIIFQHATGLKTLEIGLTTSALHYWRATGPDIKNSILHSKAAMAHYEAASLYGLVIKNSSIQKMNDIGFLYNSISALHLTLGERHRERGMICSGKTPQINHEGHDFAAPDGS